MSHFVRKYAPTLLGGAAAEPPAADAPPDASVEQTSHDELAGLVDGLVGVIGSPTEAAAATLESDSLTAALHANALSRSRIVDQFLRARHGSAKEAFHMLSSTLKWRRETDTARFLQNHRQLMCHESAHFPMCILSTAERCKQPVVYGLIRLMDKKKVERVPFNDACVAFFEAAYFAEEYSQDEMVVILDFRGWSLRKHSPFRAVKDGINTLQSYYPERLARVFLVNYPGSIRAAYTAISPVVDPGAREKIVWVPDAPLETLKNYISPKSIPTFMGGDLVAKFPATWAVNIHAEWDNPDLVPQASW